MTAAPETAPKTAAPKKAAIVIPARYASLRLPGKPLLDATGKPLIQHVYEAASHARNADRVIVATDDARIYDAVRGFDGEAVMTAATHASGSERVAEAAEQIADADVIVNLQGDEPEIDPAHIDLLIETHRAGGAFATTLACPFPDDATSGAGSPADPSCVKAVLSQPRPAAQRRDVRYALYFTRALAPYPRDTDGEIAAPADYLLHVGVYAFGSDSLKAFAGARPSPLEQREKLEQLRILDMGEQIAVALVKSAAPGIDTQEDYDAFVKRWRMRHTL